MPPGVKEFLLSVTNRGPGRSHFLASLIYDKFTKLDGWESLQIISSGTTMAGSGKYTKSSISSRPK
ncbi:Bloom syndrome protein -like protein [Caligus rogercresseyi]|uniref:Bloom syndrome protein -like protein n=1 Tax=Caligus rogercresseyi TaxID=217165 RepID=A0A7T8HHU8_CALRO|nr:Bloom syndrome protein -like protein [Caligus rogercresseyi]